MQSHRINAYHIDSTIPANERRHILDRVAKGKVKILFVTPERLQNRNFLEAIQDIEISMVAVDECHCVTSWGHDFRSDYLKIGELINNLPVKPVIKTLFCFYRFLLPLTAVISMV